MVDSSGNGRNGSWGSTSASATSLLTGDSNAAATMNGTSGSPGVVTAGAWMAPLTAITLECWFKTSSSSLQSLIARSAAGGFGTANAGSYRVYISSGQLTFQVFNSSYNPMFTLTAGSGLANNATHHMVATWDGSTAVLYVDGAQVGTTSGSGTMAPLGTLGLNVGSMSGNFNFSGVLDEAAVYGTALSSGRVATHYAVGTGSGPTPVTISGTQASETDTAQSGSTAVGAVISGGQGAESDTALAGTAQQGTLIGGSQAVETDDPLAGSVAVGAVVGGGQATETDTAQPGTTTGAVVVVGGGQASESDAALPGVVDDGVHDSDAANDAYALTLGGWGVVEWEPAVVPVPGLIYGPGGSVTPVRQSVISAIAYGPVTMQGTQPVFTYSEADRPRLRERVLLGGRDVTYDRGVPIPDVEYELADLLLYGPGTLDLPAYMAAWEIGTDATDRTNPGRRVKVQLVDDFTDPEAPTVVATVYKGFVMNPDVRGRFLSLELGGEAQGRAALLDKQVPVFREVLDLKRMLWRDLTDTGVRFLPRLGEPGVGIRALNWGGTGLLEHIEEVLARMVKKDGTQRAVMPDDQGVYRLTDKDTTTVHYSVFVDDAFTVPTLSSDLAEKPNRIFASAISPSGMRIDFAAVPGILATPAPDYPMADNSAFGEGTTNEDTDTGDGVSVMIRRLGAVGLLDIRDVPGGFDDDVADALEALARKARLTGPVGEMTPALWRVLWDLDQTGRDKSWSSIQPAAQAPETMRYLRSGSGGIIGLNPDYDDDVVKVDETLDMGSGLRERQVRNFAETRVHHPGEKVWYGTITVNMGAVLAGQVDIGATITADDLIDVRLVRPGENLWVPNFDGGTLFHISGIQVGADSVTLTVDTRARPAREIWERLQVRRETRRDPSRRWLSPRQSTSTKDAVRGFLSWGGVVDRDVPLEAGWNVIDQPVGDYGTIARIRTNVQTIHAGEGGSVSIEGHEYAIAVFGKPVTKKWLDNLVAAPLTKDGERKWRRRATRRQLREHDLLYSAGADGEPCGYGVDLKSDGATLTGEHEDDAGFRYVADDGVTVYVAVWVADPSARLLSGRIMWPLLEGGI